MALTTELLNANAALSGLTDEQKGAIVEMSLNDENSVIAKKTGEIYGGLDADILTASGIAKNGTEKTFDYAKRVIGEIRAKADGASTLQTKVDELTAEKARLEDLVSKGGSDAETRRLLEQARADLENVTKEYTSLRGKYDSAVSEHEKALLGVRMDSEFAKASSGIKFKADLPAAVTDVLLQQAIAKVKGMNPEYINDGQGGTVLAFMENGIPRRNPENNLNPYTAQELIRSELKAMGVLDDGRKQTGAGTSGGGTGSGGGTAADLSGATTQQQAHEAIAKQLMAQGLVNGSAEFDERMAKAWKENQALISKLPVA